MKQRLPSRLRSRNNQPMTLRFAICQLAFVTLSAALLAQGSPTPSPTPAATSAGITTSEAATRAWLDTMPANEKTKSDAYFEGTYWLILWNFVVDAAIALLLLTTRLSARIRDLAALLTTLRPIQAAIYGIGFTLIAWVLNFPL